MAQESQIPSRIEEVRTDLAVSKKVFAELIDYPYKRYTEIAAGNAREDTQLLAAVSLQAGVAGQWLLTGEGPMYAHETAQVKRLRKENVDAGVAGRLRRLRFVLGEKQHLGRELSQAELAEKAGLHRTNLNAIENARGDRSLKLAHLLALATNTGVNLHWLITGDGPVFESEQAAAADPLVGELVKNLSDEIAGSELNSELADLTNTVGEERTVELLRAFAKLPETTQQVLLRTLVGHTQPTAESARRPRRARKKTPLPGGTASQA